MRVETQNQAGRTAVDLTLSRADLTAIVQTIVVPANSHAEPAAAKMSSGVGLNALLETKASYHDFSTIYGDQTATAAPAEAASGGDDSAELAKKLTNPVASLISVPFQFNYDAGFGPKNGGKYTLNVQPVIPISLNADWNLIVRTIVPVAYLDSIADGTSSTFGLGDTVQSFFFSPKAPTSGGWIWGAGPVFLWPTATNDLLGSGKWGAGPTAVLLKQENGWTYGALANHIWSYAGSNDRGDINATFIQPFISYTTKTYTTFTLNTESTYDWTSSHWTVPINLSVSQLLKIGGQPVQFAVGPRYYAERPDGGPEWGVRFTVTFLFPK